MGYGTSIDVISAFIVTFTLPYLLNASGANLGPKVGWILMGDSVFSLIFAAGFLPELAGRSLEEMDELFGVRFFTHFPLQPQDPQRRAVSLLSQIVTS